MSVSASPLSCHVHGTAVAFTVDGGYRAVLLRGPSGSGKSDVALRLIDGGAVLVADDQVIVSAAGGALSVEAPPTIAGLLEVRGLGLVKMPVVNKMPLALVVDLVPRADVPRLPVPNHAVLLDIPVPQLALHAFDAATPAKIRLALAVVDDAGKVIR